MSNKFLFSKITLFLNQFKECANQGKVDYSEINRKTTIFLRQIGWTNKAMENFILNSIEPKHYFRGPTDHHYDSDCSVVEFGMYLDECNIELYVKLELIAHENEFVAGYMSFHEREQVIDIFPLDTTGEVR